MWRRLTPCVSNSCCLIVQKFRPNFGSTSNELQHELFQVCPIEKKCALQHILKVLRNPLEGSMENESVSAIYGIGT